MKLKPIIIVIALAAFSPSIWAQQIGAVDANIGRSGTPEDARTKLGTVPEFHPELGLGALEGYLGSEKLLDSLTLIPPPPTPGSAALAHDKEVAEKTFALRGTPRFALAASDFELELPVLIGHFACALDAKITKENAPYLYNLLSRSFSDLALSTYSAKNYYQRKRPFQHNNQPIAVPEMKSMLEKDPSYPSGHSAIGWGFALILTEIAPERADKLIDRGRAYTESRIVANHHWYSDVVWGRFMGAATVAKLHANPTFLADLKTAKEEFAAIRAKGAGPGRDCEAEAGALELGFQARDVIAIDILLLPDDELLGKAEAVNAKLNKAYPKGFTLDEGWLASTFGPRKPWVADPVDISQWDPMQDSWELFDTRKDFSLMNDLASDNPAQLEELKELFMKEAEENKILPIGGGLFVGLNPQEQKRTTNTEWTLFDGMTRIPESQAPNVRNGNLRVEIEAEVPEGVNGVIFAMGGYAGGVSLFAVDDELHYEYSALLLKRDKNKVGKLPAGEVKIALEMRTPLERAAPAALKFWINGKEATGGTVQRTIPLVFAASETFDIGRDTCSPVANDHFDKAPFKFEGKLKQLYFKNL